LLLFGFSRGSGISRLALPTTILLMN
jgi:hypothetical protein